MATVQPINTNLLLAESGLANALYGEQATATQAAGTQNALNIQAGGAAQEAGQYQTAEEIAQQNAKLAGVSGELQQYQNTRVLMNTLGTQAADISGAGFADSGSALSLAKSSLRQGLLQNQVLGENAQLEAGGYLEQAQASAAEAQGAQTTAATESAQAATAGQLSALATAEQTQTHNFLSQIPGVQFGTGPGGLTTIANPNVTGEGVSNTYFNRSGSGGHVTI